jgi:Flp pilus assembly protein TadG
MRVAVRENRLSNDMNTATHNPPKSPAARRSRQRGHAAIEVGLMLPWLVFCFVGAFDLGSASYALISVQSAARIAANYGAQSSTVAQSSSFTDGTIACQYALDSLRYAPRVGTSTTTCSGSSLVRVAASYNSPGSYGLPSAKVTVTYTLNMIPLPGLLPSSVSISRSVELPIRS